MGNIVYLTGKDVREQARRIQRLRKGQTAVVAACSTDRIPVSYFNTHLDLLGSHGLTISRNSRRGKYRSQFFTPRGSSDAELRVRRA